jgi:hypothetical protein
MAARWTVAAWLLLRSMQPASRRRRPIAPAMHQRPSAMHPCMRQPCMTRVARA